MVLENKVVDILGSDVITTTVEKVLNWSRKNALWPVTMGLSCAIEMMATASSRYDMARFGAEVFRASPRQADLLIVAGTLTKRWLQWCGRCMSRCPNPSGLFPWVPVPPAVECLTFYSVVQGVDEVIPVDVYVPGCPPRPEALLYGVMQVQRKLTR